MSPWRYNTPKKKKEIYHGKKNGEKRYHCTRSSADIAFQHLVLGISILASASSVVSDVRSTRSLIGMKTNYATVGGAVMAFFGAFAVVRYYVAPWPGADPMSAMGGAVIFLIGAAIVAYGGKVKEKKK